MQITLPKISGIDFENVKDEILTKLPTQAPNHIDNFQPLTFSHMCGIQEDEITTKPEKAPEQKPIMSKNNLSKHWVNYMQKQFYMILSLVEDKYQSLRKTDLKGKK